MGILIKAGVDDHGLRSRKSIAQTSTTSTSNGHTATATTYNKHPVTSIHTATATTYNDERNPRKEGFRAMRDPRRRRSTCTHREHRRATSPPWRSPFSSPTPWLRPVWLPGWVPVGLGLKHLLCARPSSLRMGQPLALTPWREVASLSVGLKMEGAFRSTAMTRS